RITIASQWSSLPICHYRPPRRSSRRHQPGATGAQSLTVVTVGSASPPPWAIHPISGQDSS
ncbi:hypothetical protein E2562_013557, partial [Oryza meyeriana var. granulata]